MTPIDDLLATERGYFEAGARRVALLGATLAHMPAFQDVAASAVVHRIHPDGVTPDPLAWLVRVEQITAGVGLARSRLVIDTADSELELALAMLGYRRRATVGMLRRAAPIRRQVTLEPITDDDGWRRKLAVHPSPNDRPDGVTLDPTRWTAFERVKANAGYFTAYLALEHGVPCGAVAAARQGSMLRVKNLVVAPAHRGRGVGAAIMAAMVHLAHDERRETVGAFAPLGGRGERCYRGVGFAPAVHQVAWDRALTPVVPARRGPKQACAHG